MADLDGTDAHLSNAISLEGLAVEQEPFPLEGSPTLSQTLVPPPSKHGAGQNSKCMWVSRLRAKHLSLLPSSGHAWEYTGD